MELQRSLVEDPGRRQFRVLRGNHLIMTDSSVDDPINYTHDGAGDLGGWVAQHADGLLFQLIPGMNSPPVYEMSEDLARYLNGRGAVTCSCWRLGQPLSRVR